MLVLFLLPSSSRCLPQLWALGHNGVRSERSWVLSCGSVDTATVIATARAGFMPLLGPVCTALGPKEHLFNPHYTPKYLLFGEKEADLGRSMNPSEVREPQDRWWEVWVGPRQPRSGTKCPDALLPCFSVRAGFKIKHL